MSATKIAPRKQERSLVDLERKFHEAEDRHRESIFEAGAVLAEIKSGEVWKQAGCKSWNDYCKSGRVVCSRQHADRLIAAHNIKGSIADAPTGATWSERAVRELVRLMDPKIPETANHREVARISKNVVKRIEGGELLTAKLVKKVAEEDLYKNSNRAKRIWAKREKQRKKREEELDKKYGDKTMQEMVRNRAAELSLYLDDYKKFGDLAWDEVSDDTYEWMIKNLTEMRDFFEERWHLQSELFTKKLFTEEPYNGNCTHGCNLLPKPTGATP